MRLCCNFLKFHPPPKKNSAVILRISAGATILRTCLEREENAVVFCLVGEADETGTN